MFHLAWEARPEPVAQGFDLALRQPLFLRQRRTFLPPLIDRHNGASDLDRGVIDRVGPKPTSYDLGWGAVPIAPGHDRAPGDD